MSGNTQKFCTGIACPRCEKDGCGLTCPDLWIEDNGDGMIYDGDIGYCDECGNHFSLLVDAYDNMYAYVDEDEALEERE